MLKSIKYFSVIILLSQIQCSDPTGPPPPVKPVKDPRTYTWTTDTLQWGTSQTILRRIWGSSASDVYFGGHSSGSSGGLWHYDGKDFSVVTLPEIRSPDANAIYGFVSNDIWAVGSKWYHNTNTGKFTDSSFICHYNGALWQQYEIVGGGYLLAVWGGSPTDVWAGGFNTLLHFDGVEWKKFPFYLPPQDIQMLSIAGLSINDVYMIGGRNDFVQPIDTSFYYMYHYNGSQWSVIDSTYSTSSGFSIHFGSTLKEIGGNMYSARYKLFKKEGSSWTIINDDSRLLSIGGSNENNIFAGGSNGVVYHYNGTDWQEITVSEGLTDAIYDIWTDGTEAFMVSNDGYRTFVMHGK